VQLARFPAVAVLLQALRKTVDVIAAQQIDSF
jgi:hypothetical protein